MKKPKRTYKFKPCPDPIKGTWCGVCGAGYVCVQPWRKFLKNGRRTTNRHGVKE